MHIVSRSPLISVLVPTRQSRRYLDDRIESILAQGVDDIEVVNVDTQSTDGTVQALGNAFGTRLRTFQQGPGLYGAWNRAIREARGTYLHFATSDDYEDPDFYASCLGVLEKQPEADAVSTQWKAVDDAGKETLLHGWDTPTYRSYIGYEQGRARQMNKRALLFYTLYFGYPAGICNATLYRRSAFEKVGMFPETYGPSGDWGWWLAAAARCNLWMLDRELANWRVSDGQATATYARFNRYRKELSMLRDTLQVLLFDGALDFLPEEDRAYVQHFIQQSDATLALEGKRFYLRLLGVQPDKVLHMFTKKCKRYYAPFWISRMLHSRRLRPIPEAERGEVAAA